MFGSIKTIVAALMAVLIISVAVYAADDIRCSVLQQKLDRIYFPVGTEAHIYQNAPFTLLHGNDTLYRGTIEFSFEGVSISRVVAGAIDSIALDSLEAVITPARIDRLSPVTIGVHGVNRELLPKDDAISHADVVEREIIVHEYDDQASMILDFESGRLDGCISFDDNEHLASAAYVLTSPYPFIAAMIPNITRAINQQGALTTSLFYRFDPSRLGLYFDGDKITAVNSFISANEDSSFGSGRLYRHDPKSGRSLFQSLPDRPQSLNLYVQDTALSPLAAYLADILARDHCPVQMVTDRRKADIYLEFVPVDDSLPAASVFYLHRRLATDSVAGTQAAEQLRIIDGYFRTLMATGDRSQYFHFLNLAQREMTADLGLFALFRPTMFFSAHRQLQGVRFDHRGRLDLKEAYLLLLSAPPAATEVIR